MRSFKFISKKISYKSENIFKFSFILSFLSIYLLNSTHLGDTPKVREDLTLITEKYNRLKKRLDEIEFHLEKIDEKKKLIFASYFLDNESEKVKTIDEHPLKKESSLEEQMNFLNKKMTEEASSLDALINVAKKKDLDYNKMPAIFPLDKKYLRKPISGFGLRFHPILKIPRMHYGMDFPAKSGSPVYATGDGVVKTVGYQNGFGNTIVINHENGFLSSFSHLKDFVKGIKKGKRIKRGEKIAEVGSTGLSTGPHLHYEIHQLVKGKKWEKINPLPYLYEGLTLGQYSKIIEMAKSIKRSLD